MKGWDETRRDRTICEMRNGMGWAGIGWDGRKEV